MQLVLYSEAMVCPNALQQQPQQPPLIPGEERVEQGLSAVKHGDKCKEKTLLHVQRSNPPSPGVFIEGEGCESIIFANFSGSQVGR